MPLGEPYTDETPLTLLEASEVADDTEKLLNEAARQLIEKEERLQRIVAWIVEANSLVGIGVRARVAASKLRVNELDGSTLEDIARECGWRRTAVCNIGQDFTGNFGDRGLHDRSLEVREKAHYRTCGTLAGRIATA